MFPRLLLMLLAASLLGSGAYLARRSRSSRPSGLEEERPAPRLPASRPGYAARIAFTEVSPRIAVLLVAACLLGSAAYFGLGGETLTEASGASDAAARTSATHAETLSLKRLESPAAARLSPPAAPTAAPTPGQTPAPTPELTPAPTAVPASPPPPPPVAAAQSFPTDGFEAIICSMPWPCHEAIAVAACESGRGLDGRLDGNWATNGSNFGLFQINGVHASRWPDFYESWMDPAKNTQWAYEIWAESGWRLWSCKPWY